MAEDIGRTKLSVRSSTATPSDDQPFPHSLLPKDIDAGNDDNKKINEKDKGSSVAYEELIENGHVVGSGHGPTFPSTDHMLFMGKDSAPSLASNTTTNRTRDLLTWRLKDQTRLKDLTKKILASVKDQWRRNEEFGILKKHPHEVGASDGQSEAGSQVRLQLPAYFSKYHLFPFDRQNMKL